MQQQQNYLGPLNLTYNRGRKFNLIALFDTEASIDKLFEYQAKLRPYSIALTFDDK